MSDTATLVAAHIAQHGVTRCPAAIVAPCNVELSPADIEAHRARKPVEPIGGRVPWQPLAANRRGNRR